MSNVNRHILLSSLFCTLVGTALLSGQVSLADRVTALPTPTPVPALSRARNVTPSPTPTPLVKPSPSLTPTPVPTPLPSQTLDELQSKLRQRLFAPEVRRGRVGVKIVSLNSGKVIFENDSEKYFMPASNMKNFTVSTAMERLTPDFRFVTSVYADAPPVDGTVKGDLRVFGRGDISISTAFNNGDYYKGLDNLVDRIAAAGVKRVEGSLIADESYFKGPAIPGSWERDDLQWYYGAEISALPLNDNAVDLSVSPGSTGNPCVIAISPANSLVQVQNLCTTSNGGSKRAIEVNKLVDRNVVEVRGTMPASDQGFKGSVTFTHPAELFITLLKQRLELKGITFTGSARVQPSNIRSPANQIEIAKLESPPFSVIAAKTMKPSQNMYTETILWTLGEQFGRASDPNSDSSELGLKAVKSFLKEIGIPDDGIVQHDGSGLSRHDLITPAAVVALYTYMAKQSRFAQAWRDSLTIGGIDGTLANRFKGTAAANNIRGKTGTIDQVSALSGYMTTAAGEPVILSIVVNGVPETRTRTSLIDDLVVNVANFAGRLD